MKILVLDDDKYYIEYVKDFLERLQFKLNEDLDIMYISKIEDMFNYQNIHLMILDIDIEKHNILDYYQDIIRTFPSAFICYLTNHMTYMPRAFGMNVIKYIEKKDISSLESVIRFVNHYFDQNGMTFKTHEGYKKVLFNEILYIESNNRKLILHTIDEDIRIFETGIQHIGTLLPQQFILINKQEIINLDLVTLFTKYTVKLRHTDHKLYISRRKYNEVYKRFIEWSDLKSYEYFK